MRHVAAAQANQFNARRRVPSTTREFRDGFGPHLSIQRERAGAIGVGAPDLIRDVIASPGQPLDPHLRSVMEPGLGYDFSSVRVHSDTPAAQSAHAIGANAYTAGDHIVFGAGKFDPSSTRGQRLVAHELAHVIQQADGPVAGRSIDDCMSMSTPDDSFERAAATLSESAMKPHAPANPERGPVAPLPATSRGPGPIAVQRQGDTPGSIVGAVAGVVGAVAGLVALGIAIAAWLRPRNPAPVSGGITINPQPISVTPSDGVPPERQDAAIGASTHTEKLLDLKTDNKNFAVINVDVATDGVSIMSATPQAVTAPNNYNGGTGGSSAVLNFAAPTTLTPPKYDTAKPEPAKADTKKAAPKGGKGKTETPPPAPAPKDTPAVLQVAFNGTNSVGEKEPLQQFAGRLVIRANGSTGGHHIVECVECAPRNQVGYADTDTQKVGHVDYHGHVAPQQQNTPPAPGPQQTQPTPPPPPAPGK
jgi:hypothetical protein